MRCRSTCSNARALRHVIDLVQGEPVRPIYSIFSPTFQDHGYCHLVFSFSYVPPSFRRLAVSSNMPPS